MTVHPDDKPGEVVLAATGGHGADRVVITASSASNAVLSGAFGYCRPKGRVVVVGDVGLAINRSDIYERELEFRISTSYGPGRYDSRYEEGGLDYPIGYVRWTEQRNMQAYLEFLAKGDITVAPLIERTFPVDGAADAYAFLESDKPMLVLLDHAGTDEDALSTRIERKVTASKQIGKVRLTLIGAGDFVRVTHLPNIQALSSQVEVRGIVTRRGLSSMNLAETLDADWTSTTPEDAFQDEETDAVLIATRHDSHAELVVQALQAGKHVFVEKPLAMTPEGLEKIEAFYEQNPDGPLLMTGFNRRFSPTARSVKELMAKLGSPFIVNYRMNAGLLPEDHWVHGPEGGGRNIGEACHIYDLFTAWTGAPAKAVDAMRVQQKDRPVITRNNFFASIRFDDGSIANLTYTDQGNPAVPKETFEVYCGGQIVSGIDYKELNSTSGKSWNQKAGDKGHLAALEAFLKCVREGGEWPIPLWEQVQATRISFDVERQFGEA